MAHRTYLTAPPGTEPTEATGRAADEPRERYVPGLAPVREPTVPSRWRTPLLLIAGVAVVVTIVVTVLRVSAAQQAQDPSLFVPGVEQDDGASLRDGIPGGGDAEDGDGELDDDAGPDGGALPGDG